MSNFEEKHPVTENMVAAVNVIRPFVDKAAPDPVIEDGTTLVKPIGATAAARAAEVAVFTTVTRAATFAMLAVTIVVAFAATAIVARMMELEGADGATGDTAGVPATIDATA